jgi:hypothetical protein
MNEKYMGALVDDALAESKADLEAMKLSREDRIVAKAKPMVKIDIWCDECKQDYQAVGIKKVQGDNAVYKTYCPNNHIVLRRINKKHLDSYFRKSKKVQVELRKYADDLLQEGEDGYWSKYGRHQQYEKEMEMENQLRQQPKDKAHKNFYAI